MLFSFLFEVDTGTQSHRYWIPTPLHVREHEETKVITITSFTARKPKLGNSEVKVTKVPLNQPIYDKTLQDNPLYYGGILQNLLWGFLLFPPLSEVMVYRHKTVMGYGLNLMT